MEMPAKGKEFDHLTEIPNRRQYDLDLSAYQREAKEGNSPLTIAVIDLDNFKPINDQKGHAIGDQALKMLAGRIRQVIAGKGDAYRYGGDEFVAILPNHTLEEGTAVAERIRSAVETIQLSPDLKLSVTIGISAFPLPTDDINNLFDDADKALREGKNRKQKNNVHVSSSGKALVSGKRNLRFENSWTLTVELQPAQPVAIPEHKLLDCLMRSSYSIPLFDFGRRIQFPLFRNRSNLDPGAGAGRIGAKWENKDWGWFHRYELSANGSVGLVIVRRYSDQLKFVDGNTILDGLMRFVPFASRFSKAMNVKDYNLTVSLEGILGAELSLNIGLLFVKDWVAKGDSYASNVSSLSFADTTEAYTDLLLQIIHPITAAFCPVKGPSLSDFNREWLKGELEKFLRHVTDPGDSDE